MAQTRTPASVESFEDEDFVFVGGPTHLTEGFARRLCAHPGLWCGPERHLVPVIAELSQRWRRTIGEDLAQAGVDGAALDEAARAWVTTFLRAGVPEQRRVCDRSVRELVHMRWLGSLFPRARFVHLVGGAQVDEVRRQAVDVGDRYLEIDGEDLWMAPRATMERVLAFLDEPWDDAVIDGAPLLPRGRAVGYEDYA